MNVLPNKTMAHECPPPGIDHDLIALYYGELRQIARAAMRGSPRMTLQPTDLAHAAAVRLLEISGVSIQSESHLLALAARVIRATFIDEIRRRKASKRNFEAMAILPDSEASGEFDMLCFDDLLSALAEFEPEGARVVELRFFAGLSMKEIACALGMPERTVHRRWASARAWLLRELKAA